MNYTIKLYPTFKKQFKHLLKRYKSLEADTDRLVESLLQSPYQGADLDRGLLYIYDKSERETLTDAELTELLRRNGII